MSWGLLHKYIQITIKHAFPLQRDTITKKIHTNPNKHKSKLNMWINNDT